MEFESLDWEAEATRVARAFGVVGECEFVRDENQIMRLWMREPTTIRVLESDEVLAYEVLTQYAKTSGGLDLEVLIDSQYTSIELTSCINDNEYLFTHVMFYRDNSTADLGPVNRDYISQMAKGLFHLGLLSPEVERDLKVSISAHEKMEWVREFEARG